MVSICSRSYDLVISSPGAKKGINRYMQIFKPYEYIFLINARSDLYGFLCPPVDRYYNPVRISPGWKIKYKYHNELNVSKRERGLRPCPHF